ncbi:hypothetical protein JCM14469_41620 [Desulfatiferula olefinivorans]
MNAIFFIFFCVITFSFSGCATIVSKSHYPVSISSQPDEAEIIVKNSSGLNVFAGRTPSTINLKAGAGFFRGEKYTVTFNKEGYTPFMAEIKRGVDGWYIAGNFFFGGLVGWLIVDPATGAMWKLEDLHVDLNPIQASCSDSTFKVVTIDNIPNHLRSKMIRVN